MVVRRVYIVSQPTCSKWGGWTTEKCMQTCYDFVIPNILNLHTLAHGFILGGIGYDNIARLKIQDVIKAPFKLVADTHEINVWRICGEFEKIGVRVCRNLKDAVKDADVINLLRIQHERQRTEYFPGTGEYAKFYGINPDSMKYISPDALIMHPGPINRGVELDSAIADGPQSVILEQVTNGLAVRMAVLFLVAGALK